MTKQQRDPRCTDTYRAVCPHCYYEHEGSWEWEEGTKECSHCEKLFTMERYVTCGYNTVAQMPDTTKECDAKST